MNDVIYFQIRACKKIVAGVLNQRQEEELNGLALRDAILYVYTDVRLEHLNQE